MVIDNPFFFKSHFKYQLQFLSPKNKKTNKKNVCIYPLLESCGPQISHKTEKLWFCSSYFTCCFR